jgi:hypothetical protein
LTEKIEESTPWVYVSRSGNKGKKDIAKKKPLSKLHDKHKRATGEISYLITWKLREYGGVSP